MSQKFFRKLSVDLREMFVEISVFQGSVPQTMTQSLLQKLGDKPVTFVRHANRRDQMLTGLKDAIQSLNLEVGPEDMVEIRSDYLDTLWREQWLAPMALLCTEGFQNVLEISDQTRTSVFTLKPAKKAASLSANFCFGVAERVNALGEVTLKPTTEELETIAAKLKLSDIKHVAISFLHSKLNSENENAVRDFLIEQGFEVETSSSDSSQILVSDERLKANSALRNLAQNWTFKNIQEEFKALGFAEENIIEKTRWLEHEAFIVEDKISFPKSNSPFPFSPLSPVFADQVGTPQIRYAPIDSEPGPVCFGKGVELTIFDLLVLKHQLKFDDVKKIKVDHARVKKHLTLLSQQMRTDWESAMTRFLELANQLFESEIALYSDKSGRPLSLNQLHTSGWLAPYFLGRIKV